ncbi:flagellar hook-length control protein FliK [Bradyrhizobium lablabi]|uniref:flagellar hook-length control protein FliK n=1 Tax=Bradyrhizobium lablabi TaxID=722472 RepID=UPI001BAB8F24|nr:flagellar hook-length control protein FliK [Bradyrhizobium lablabi]MBR1124098.1 flagellar hook-length control protein FliK [Bradyrhizobium lablabi]
MAITINPVLPILPAQEAGAVAPELLLQPGKVIDARVLKVLQADLVRIAIGALSLDVRTEIPLEEGQALKLAVSQTESGIRLTNVGQGADTGDAVSLSPGALSDAPLAPSSSAPPKLVLTPLEKVAVTIAAQTSATVQDSQAPLFADLGTAATSPALPPKLQQAMAQVLAQQTSLDQDLSGQDIKTAFQKSGLLLEASLAAGSVPSAGVPDLKAALIVLRQALRSALGGEARSAQLPHGEAVATSAPAAGQDLDLQEILLPQARVPVAHDLGSPKTPLRAAMSAVLDEGATPAATLSLLQEAVQEAGNPPHAPGFAKAAQGEEVVARTNTPPPPFRGALPSAQPVALPSLAPDTPLATSAQHLLGETDAAIARQTLLQVASLPDRVDLPGTNIDTSQPRWNFEIPFATPLGTAMAQFEISRDGGGTEMEAAKRIWRARFSLDVEPAGPVHALVSLVGDTTSVRMWAERPATAAQLRAGAAELSQALSRAELTPGDIVIRDGAPPQAQPAPAGHFLDRAL